MTGSMQIKDIIVCLETQNNLMRELMEVGQRQLEAIKDDDLPKINVANKEQENLGRQLALMEKKRRELTFQFSKEYGKEEAKLADIMQAATPEQKQILKQLSEQIICNQSKLGEINELTSLLLRQSLHYIQRLLGSISPDEQKGSGVYINRSV